MPKRIVVELENINMVYHTLEDETLAIKNLSMDIHEGEIIGIVGLILRENEKTAILVTHDIAEAISLCDRVIIMSKRPGTIKDDIEIKLSCDEKRTPIKLREAPEFRHYFNKIWKELDIHVQ